MKRPTWRRYIRFWGTDVRADADEELRFHIESRIQEYVASGMTPDDARAETLRRFGDIERVRQSCETIDQLYEGERRRIEMWDALMQDLRYGLRALRRNPATVGPRIAGFGQITRSLPPSTGICAPVTFAKSGLAMAATMLPMSLLLISTFIRFFVLYSSTVIP